MSDPQKPYIVFCGLYILSDLSDICSLIFKLLFIFCVWVLYLHIVFISWSCSDHQVRRWCWIPWYLCYRLLLAKKKKKKIEFRHSGGEAGALSHRSISSVPEYLLLLVVVLIATITDWCQWFSKNLRNLCLESAVHE